MFLHPGRVALWVFAAWLAAAPAVGLSQELEERPEKLEAEPAGEEKQDRLHAATLFAQGRILSQRGKHSEALARFERAWRYHEESEPILEELVPLAVKLNRLGEASRYAVIAVEKGAEIDPRTLQNLAMQLFQEEDWESARVLYQRLYELQKKGQGDEGEADIGMLLVQMELGRINFLLEDFKAAAEAFATVREALENPDKYDLNEQLQKMLLDDPERTYLLLGEAFVRGGRPDDAEAMFRKADAAKPEVLAFRLARVAAARGKTDEALAELEKYLAAKSIVAGPEPYKLLAELLKKKHADEKEAQKQLLKRLDELYAGDPANPGLAYFTAEQYIAAGRLEDAEKIYREQLTLNPTTDAHAGLIEIHRRQDQPEKLLETLAAAILETGSFDVFDEEVAKVAEDEKLVERLIAVSNEKKEKDGPQSLADGVAVAVGMLALETKKFDVANEFMDLAAEAEEPGAAQVLTVWGLGLFLQGEYAKAAEVFQRAIDDQVNPDNDAAYYFYLANALAYADRPDEALTAALQAQQLRPGDPRFESRVAWINYRALRYGDAERAYEELLNTIGEDYSSEQVREIVREAKLVLSNICVQQDRYEDGVEWLEQVLDEYPRDVGALNDLGYLWADKGLHPQRALRMVEAAVKSEPENAAYQDSLGWALFRLGRKEEAIKHLEKAVELQGEEVDGVILDHLGDVHASLDQKEKAHDAWRRAVAAFEKAEEAEEAERVKKKLNGQQ